MCACNIWRQALLLLCCAVAHVRDILASALLFNLVHCSDGAYRWLVLCNFAVVRSGVTVQVYILTHACTVAVLAMKLFNAHLRVLGYFDM